MDAAPTYEFQRLRAYQLALDDADAAYETGNLLPASERVNLSSQLTPAAASIALNIAEGSTGQSDSEQHRFLTYALRSYLETIACLDLIERRGYVPATDLQPLRAQGRQLFTQLQAFRTHLEDGRPPVSRPRSPVPKP